MSYYGKGAETSSISSEDYTDALLDASHKRKVTNQRLEKLERQVNALATTVNLMLSVMDAEARMKGGIDRIEEGSDYRTSNDCPDYLRS